MRALALLDPSHPEACVVWANRSMAALKAGLLDRAEQDASQALELNPDYEKARLRRGMTRHKRGKYKEAAEDFHTLIQVGPPLSLPR